MIPGLQKKYTEDDPEKFIYFRPLSSEFQEETKKQYQQKPAMTFHQYTREGIDHRNLGIIVYSFIYFFLSPFIPPNPLLPPPSPSACNHHTVVQVHKFFLFFFFFAESLYPVTLTQSCLPGLYLWFCLYFAC